MPDPEPGSLADLTNRIEVLRSELNVLMYRLGRFHATVLEIGAPEHAPDPPDAS